MITAAQLRAARVLLGIDQRQLAELSGLSVPTIQRMEASETMVRGNVDSLVKLIAAFDAAGIEMIDEGAVSHSQGRGVRLKIQPGSVKAVPVARSVSVAKSVPVAKSKSSSKASGKARARA
jgi:transcriptional regulator with XRE-family HTH domain